MSPHHRDPFDAGGDVRVSHLRARRARPRVKPRDARRRRGERREIGRRAGDRKHAPDASLAAPATRLADRRRLAPGLEPPTIRGVARVAHARAAIAPTYAATAAHLAGASTSASLN